MKYENEDRNYILVCEFMFLFLSSRKKFVLNLFLVLISFMLMEIFNI